MDIKKKLIKDKGDIMNITLEDIEKLNPNLWISSWFKENLPNGGTFADILEKTKQTNNLSFVCWYVRKEHLTAEEVKQALNTGHWCVRHIVVRYQNISVEQLEQASTDSNELVRCAAITRVIYPTPTDEQSERALHDEHWMVRYRTIQRYNLNTEQTEQGLTDEHYMVRCKTVELCYFNDGQIERALNDEHWMVRQAAILYCFTDSKQRDRALNDEHYEVRLASLKIGFPTIEQLCKARNDEDCRIVEIAERMSPFEH